MVFNQTTSSNSDGGIWVRDLAITYPPLTSPYSRLESQNSTDGFSVIPWSYGLDADWSCQPDETVFVHVVDGNNVTSDYNATNWLDNLSLPTTMPVTVTVWRSDTPTDVTTLQFFQNDYITGKVGSGPTGELWPFSMSHPRESPEVTSISAEPTFEENNLFVELFWCDDD